MRAHAPLLALIAGAALACSSGGSSPGTTSGHATGSGGGGPSPTGWRPGVVKPGIGDAGPRGFLDLRGIIHAHSVYSHDACDGAPRDPSTDAINQPCLDDFRRDL